MAARTRVQGHLAKHVRAHKNYCFVCGKDNPDGLHLNFYFDKKKKHFVSRFRLDGRFVGPPAHSHGGIIATVLDEAMGKVNKLRSVIALTRVMEVHYLKPVPLGKPLIVESREKRVHGRRHINVAEIRNLKGEVLARGEATFVKIDPVKMFAKFVGERGAVAPFQRRERSAR
ncbi:MAG TPA: PaaI family thioesterase [Terriglobales bacterium]|jgi:acyl-coenzyme A thioesterase PaaI-like protein|nr:PaaI family thioesterase [Terriglobales bacterium]